MKIDSTITNPFTPIPKSDSSHVRGWAMVWSQRLNANIATKHSEVKNYANIFIDHGVNFSSGLNLFGGFNDEVISRCKDIISAVNNGSKLFSLDFDISECNYIDQIEKRIGAKTTSTNLDFDFLIEFENILQSAKTIRMDGLGLSRVILGDSHSIAYSESDQAIKRINGQLLYSAMKNGIKNFICEQGCDKYNEITLCLGSIDIRFHAPDKVPANTFAKTYAREVIKAQDELKRKISICAPVPVECESRKIPKTGQYKGKNFNKSRKKRLDYTLDFISELDNYFCDFDLITPPKKWYEMDGEKYAKEIMEISSSVHIAPKNYRSIINWNK